MFWKILLIAALSFIAGAILFWPAIKMWPTKIWLRIGRRILNYFMGGEKH